MINHTEEHFDILDAEGKALGYSRPRSQVHAKGLWHRSVHIWIINQKEVLLQQRAFNKDSNPGLWDISVAGHISAGQTSLQAAVREISEEISLNVTSDRLQWIFTESSQSILNNGLFIDNEYHDIYLLEINDIERQQLKPDPKELADLKWWFLPSLKSDLLHHQTLFVNHQSEYKVVLQALEAKMNSL